MKELTIPAFKRHLFCMREDVYIHYALNYCNIPYFFKIKYCREKGSYIEHSIDGSIRGYMNTDAWFNFMAIECDDMVKIFDDQVEAERYLALEGVC